MMRALLFTVAFLAAPALAQTPDPHAGHDMSAMGHDMSGHDMASMDHDMTGHGAEGAIAGMRPERDASGTAWQPAVTPHAGLHSMAGGWMVMTHATLNLVADDQSGPRGDSRTFASGMFMASATRPLGSGALQLRGMLSPDPLMGRRGYPLLLASGETADGATPLVDRQHPHDFVMELSARYDHPAGPGTAFVYAGLPGEPAFGPPAFMHRLSIQDSPEAPVSHHWLDSTHITFGVVTAGYILGDWKLEASRFRGREPDERRWDIEKPRLDSTAVRLSWNPTVNWALQASWAREHGPEQLEPDDNQTKWSASAIHTRYLDGLGWWSTTAAWGRRQATHGPNLDAMTLESALLLGPQGGPARWTLFARAERTENNELLGAAGHHGPVYAVGKASAGVIRDVVVAPHLTVGVGGLYAVNLIPSGLEAAYGGDPHGVMGFVRLKLH